MERVVPMNQKNQAQGASGPGSGNKCEKAINCMSCLHFYITYDPQFPYGCRAVGFKSRWMPSKVMYASSGMDCQFFAGKGKAR
jgi:hypothetical protein